MSPALRGISLPSALCLRAALFAPLALAYACLSGCQGLTADQAAGLQAQNRTLTEQNNAQLAEIADLRSHDHQIEDKLIAAEEQLALSDEKLGTDHARLANYQRERAQLSQAYADISHKGSQLPSVMAAQLADLARRHASLQFDPQLGVAKLDTDVMFDSGDASLKPQASQVLGDLGEILQTAEARQMRILIVGHTDNQKLVGKEARDRYGDNWRLSTARALAVANYLKKTGVEDRRLGVAGFGGQQPIAANATAADRRRNRRVEIFIVSPDTPIVGWTESSTSLY